MVVAATHQMISASTRRSPELTRAIKHWESTAKEKAVAERTAFADLVEQRFLFLQDHGFRMTRKVEYPSFDNAEVVFDSRRCRIRLFRDRGIVSVDLAPPAPSEAWFDIATVVYHLSDGGDRAGEYRLPDFDTNDQRTDWQLRRWADILKPYLDRACQAFSEVPADTMAQRLTAALYDRLARGPHTV